MPLISLFKFVNWITGTPTPIEDGVASAFTLPLQQEIIDAMNQAPFLASGVGHRAGFVPDPGAVAGTTKFLREDATFAVPPGISPFLNSAPPFFAPQGRLTLDTSNVVMTSTVAATSSVYYYPYVGSLIPYFDGSSLWNQYDIGNSNLSLTLDSTAAHTGYQQSGKNFDFFFDPNGGTGRLMTGPAWTSDTARADAIVRQNGLWLNNASIVCRYGTNSGDFGTFSAKTLTYLGSMRATADGQTQFTFGSSAAGGGAATFGIWNAYNRQPVSTRVIDSTNNWSRASSIGSLDSSTSNRISFIYGLLEIPYFAQVLGTITVTPGVNAYVGVGLDTTSAFTGMDTFSLTGSIVAAGEAGAGPSVGFDSQEIMGWHYYQAMEAATGGTAFFNGVLAAGNYINGGLLGIGWF